MDELATAGRKQRCRRLCLVDNQVTIAPAARSADQGFAPEDSSCTDPNEPLPNLGEPGDRQQFGLYDDEEPLNNDKAERVTRDNHRGARNPVPRSGNSNRDEL